MNWGSEHQSKLLEPELRDVRKRSYLSLKDVIISDTYQDLGIRPASIFDPELRSSISFFSPFMYISTTASVNLCSTWDFYLKLKERT